MVVAATEVMYGTSTDIRNNVAARRRAWLRMCARPSASNSCGTVDSTQMLNVLRNALQNRGSCTSSEKLASPT